MSIFPIGGKRLMNRTEADLQLGMRNAPQTGTKDTDTDTDTQKRYRYTR